MTTKTELAPLLRRVRGTHEAMSRAQLKHLAALEAYVEAGGTYAELSRELGVSRQAVRQYVERGRHSASDSG